MKHKNTPRQDLHTHTSMAFMDSQRKIIGRWMLKWNQHCVDLVLVLHDIIRQMMVNIKVVDQWGGPLSSSTR